MPEDVKTDEEPETEAPQLVHDDIVKRLLDYQRRLREGAPDDPAPVSDPEMSPSVIDEVIDLTAEEELVVEGSTSTEAVPQPVAQGPGEAPADVAEVIDISTGRAAEAGPASAETKISGSDASGAEMTETASEPPDGSAVTSADLGATQALEDRIDEIERSLERLSSKFAELRSAFQDMAIAADERLADIQDVIAQLRTP